MELRLWRTLAFSDASFMADVGANTGGSLQSGRKDRGY